MYAVTGEKFKFLKNDPPVTCSVTDIGIIRYVGISS